MSTLTLSENHLDESEPRWFAVYTRYKREKLVQKRLQEKGIHSYLPTQRLTRRYERKVKTVELPLISCYVFTRITKEGYVPVLDTTDVLRFVKFSQNLIAIPDWEIQLLQRVVSDGTDVVLEQKSLLVGEEVEIATGSLAGVRGILVEKMRKNSLVVELSSIGCALRISIEPSQLRTAQFWSQ